MVLLAYAKGVHKQPVPTPSFTTLWIFILVKSGSGVLGGLEAEIIRKECVKLWLRRLVQNSSIFQLQAIRKLRVLEVSQHFYWIRKFYLSSWKTEQIFNISLTRSDIRKDDDDDDDVDDVAAIDHFTASLKPACGSWCRRFPGQPHPGEHWKTRNSWG